MPVKRILVVDDELIVRNLFNRMFGAKYEVVLAENGYEARDLVREREFDVAFVDIVMPGLDGLETFKDIRKIRPGIKVVMMTGFAVEDKVEQAKKMGVYRCLYKPFTLGEVESIFSGISGDLQDPRDNAIISD